MSSLVINGGKTLEGTVRIHGSKNSVLPILAATVLNGGNNIIHDCPPLRDVNSTFEILKFLGCSVKREGNTVFINSAGMNKHSIPENLMRELRSSIIFLGAIISRFKTAFISMPGGCELGPRPIDLHLKALRQLGIKIEEFRGYISCTADNLKPADIHLSFPSVGATENIILAAATIKGTTTITNAAKEPEIIDLQNYLNEMGADISGAGTGTIVINGREKFHDVEHTVIPDRIVAATYLCAGMVAGGEIEVTNVRPEHMKAVTSLLRECGALVHERKDSIVLRPPLFIKPVEFLRTLPYPGFPTDAQSLFMSVLALAKGTSIIVENIFESRYKNVNELKKMGADISVDGRVAVIKGVDELYGANVCAHDLRGGAGLIIAALAAQGQTIIDNADHIYRGYYDMENSMRKLGASIYTNEG